MLPQQRIIPGDSGTQIVAALREMLREAEAGTFPHAADAADVPPLIEAELQRRLGEAAGWLHTARSRNDQVATAFRLWVKEACVACCGAVVDAQEALLRLAGRGGPPLLAPPYP